MYLLYSNIFNIILSFIILLLSYFNYSQIWKQSFKFKRDNFKLSGFWDYKIYYSIQYLKNRVFWNIISFIDLLNWYYKNFMSSSYYGECTIFTVFQLEFTFPQWYFFVGILDCFCVVRRKYRFYRCFSDLESNLTFRMLEM